MPRKSVDKRDADERREDALRPCRYLGYDRDTLGMHLVSREAYRIAETQFRRAVWLNPFEPRFKTHLAWCLYKQGRHADALACLAEVPDAETDADMHTIVRLIKQGVSKKSIEDGG
jgi:thioredoxin-like negative regulator of GroEL